MATVRLQTLPPRPLAVVRRRAGAGELARVVPECCGLVWNYLREQTIAGAGRHVALYWDSQINLEIGVELDTPFAGNGDVVASATPAGRVATATHLGPYRGLQQTHAAIRQWCAEHGHELAGPSWEIYGHWEDSWNRDPAKILTDVFYLVR
jgi:effector-binding domain-containing protein